MREVVRDGIQWSVRETEATRLSAACADRCLIFDSDTIVRRVWAYPDAWEQLNDDELWALVGTTAHTHVTPRESRSAVARATAPVETARVLALAAETTERAHSLLSKVALLHDANAPLRRDAQALLDCCREQRNVMRQAVECYAATMRASGVAPEQAIVRIKGAVTDGVGASIVVDDPDAEAVLRDAVAWGIAAYYAA
jgi:hypothetical protein